MSLSLKPIRVTYRAVFCNPKKGPLNPMGLPLPKIKMSIEIYKATSGAWQAREKDTGKDRSLTGILAAQSPESAKERVRDAFVEQVTPWTTWGVPPDAAGTTPGPRLIRPDEIEMQGDRVMWKVPRTTPLPEETKANVRQMEKR